MNKLIKITISLLLSIFVLSCNEEENIKKLDDQLVVSLQKLESKGYIVDSKIEGNLVSVVYPDGEEIRFNVDSKTKIPVYDNLDNKLFTANFKKQENNSFELANIDVFDNKFQSLTSRNPDHDGQDFCTCYKNDVDEFCDGLVGCVSLLHPLVHAVIAAHCVYETGTTECAD